MYKWFLAVRYLHTKLIALFGVAAVMLCVAMVLVVMSVMGGFLDTIRARSRGLHSEIVLDNRTLQGFPLYEEFAEYVRAKLPDVVRVTSPAIWTYGLFRIPTTNYTKPARVNGIRLDEYVQLNSFGKGLFYNRYYPGTTHLGPQKMPVAGLNSSHGFTLPEELVQANNRWRATETDPKAVEDFDRDPFHHSPYPFVTPDEPGERVFAAAVGEPGYFDAPHSGIIVGCDLLHERRPDGKFDRGYARGTLTTLSLVPLTPAGNRTGEPSSSIPLRYADDSRTGIYDIDSFSVYVDFDMIQQRLAMDAQPLVEEEWDDTTNTGNDSEYAIGRSDSDAEGNRTISESPDKKASAASNQEALTEKDNPRPDRYTRPRTNQLLIGLVEGSNLDEARDRIQAAWLDFLRTIPDELTEAEIKALGYVETFTWEDLQRHFIAAVEKEKVLVTILFGLISLVAVALIGCIFYMMVEKKTRDIGILKSVGASNAGVSGMFIVYAAAIGVAGAVLGVLLGSVFVWYINDIQDFLASLNPNLRVWSPDVYSFDRIPESVKTADALWIALFAVLSSIGGALLPARIAGRIWPVQALRYE